MTEADLPGATPSPGDHSGDEHTRRLGPCRHLSPLRESETRFISDDSRVLRSVLTSEIGGDLAAGRMPPSFELAGPRESIYFEPGNLAAGIVTCGGICPGLNNVVRALVLTLWHHYGARRILGFRYGFLGLTPQTVEPPIELSPDLLGGLMARGGTVLGTSRGPQDLDEIIDTLEGSGLDVLFCIGGDGTLRGAWALEQRLRERGLQISIVCIPKTIDNDIQWVTRSFGFTTAVNAATHAIAGANAEAEGVRNGVGLVKLMGRHAGFIAANATLARSDVNFCLVPECPVPLEGESGLLRAIERRLDDRGHAVVVVAEGFGQDLMGDGQPPGVDASGNLKLEDIGPFLKARIAEHMASRRKHVSIKYIDPSYIIRSVPAGAYDAQLCHVFAQHAVHAAVTGRSGLMIGHVNGQFCHVPIPEAIRVPRRIEPRDAIWQRVLEATGQNASFRPTS